MKKVALATCYIHNYGACLQAYALQKTIEELEFLCEIIPYEPKSAAKKESFINRIKRVLRNNPIESIYKSIWVRILSRQGKKRSEYFNSFIKNHLVFSSTVDPKFDLNIQDFSNYEVFVCGSDQIWNPRIFGDKNQPAYFLDFAPSGRKRIAYAPSIGVSEVPENCKVEMQELLNKITFLSVREETGAKIIKELTGKTAKVVLDPTLLFSPNKWNTLAKKVKIKGPYILCYLFGDQDYIFKFVKYLKKTTKMQVFALPYNPREMMGYVKQIYKAGPLEFLGLIKNANLVCTDSFHATIFSIQFQKPFYTLARFSEKESVSQNSRVYNLLRKLKLESRLITADQNFPDKTEFFNVDFTKAENLLMKEREESLNYLKSAFSIKN